MKYSRLKHDIDILELNHKHEAQLLKMKQDIEKKELLSKCNHIYEDGTSARGMRGDQRDYYYVCEICGRSI